MSVRFTPPFPPPHASKSSFLLRFWRGWHSWIHVLFERSYTMKMGEIHTPALDFYIANELPLVRRILETEWKQFPKHDFQHDLLRPLIGNSVFSANGQDWEDQRQMVNPAFGHTALKTVFPMMSDAVDDLIAHIRALDLTRPVPIDVLITHLAADIIYRTLFSVVLDTAGSREIYDAFHAYQKHSQRASTLRIYGLPMLGFRIEAWTAAVLALTLYASAFLAEIWRGGVEAIPDGQWDAAASLGLHPLAQLRLIVLPQAFAITRAPIVGFLVQLVKSTALTSIIGFDELMKTSNAINNATFQPFTVYGFVALIYFALCFPLTRYAKLLEQRTATAGR